MNITAAIFITLFITAAYLLLAYGCRAYSAQLEREFTAWKAELEK